jgi:broad specificity phosphatase PhoE
MNTVFLVRHGENKANLTKEMSCRRIDYPLTDKGRLQAQQTAEYFGDKGIDAVFSSPLLRAKETAESIARALDLGNSVIEEFREVDVGSMEIEKDLGESWRKHKEIISGWLGGDTRRRFPDGENMDELRGRFKAGLLRAVEGRDGRRIVIVGHGGIFTFALPSICEVGDLEEFYKIDTHNCAIAELRVMVEVGELRAELRRWGDIGHLHGQAAELVRGLPEGY